MRSLRVLFLLFCWSALGGCYAQDSLDAHYRQVTEKFTGHKHILSKTSADLDKYDVTYQRLELALNPDIVVPTIAGKVTTYFRPTVNGFSVFSFSLVCTMTVDSVIYHGQSLTASCASDVFTVTLPAPLPQDEMDSLHIYYRGNPVNAPGFTRTNTPDGPIIWTLSEPYGAADWWPCKQGLTDKIDSIDILVTTRSVYRVASNGILAGEYMSDTNKVFYWKHRYPIAAYLVAVAVCKYAVFSEYVKFTPTDSLEILNYVYPVSFNSAKIQVPEVVPVIKLYDSLFGPYPFRNEKYGHAQFSRGGGMEHQTMSFMSGFNFDLMAHELAHQWFGDKITCGTWSDLWLNEGFATYLNGLAYDFLKPKSDWLHQVSGWINTVTAKTDGSVYVIDTLNPGRLFDQRLTYQKGAMLLQMLRWKLGDSLFFKAVRNYITDPFLAYRFARTSDLKKELEQTGGMNLDEFFADWYYGEGYPVYTITWKQQGSKVEINVKQTPSHTSVAFFEIPVPLYLKDKDNTRDTIVVVDPSSKDEDFTVFLSFQADSMKFDPDMWLLARASVLKLNSNQVKPNQVFVYPNPAAGKVTISSNDLAFNRYEVYDVLGRRVLQQSFDQQVQAFSLSLEEIQNGAYFIRLYCGNVVVTEKFIRL